MERRAAEPRETQVQQITEEKECVEVRVPLEDGEQSGTDLPAREKTQLQTPAILFGPVIDRAKRRGVWPPHNTCLSYFCLPHLKTSGRLSESRAD